MYKALGKMGNVINFGNSMIALLFVKLEWDAVCFALPWLLVAGDGRRATGRLPEGNMRVSYRVCSQSLQYSR